MREPGLVLMGVVGLVGMAALVANHVKFMKKHWRGVDDGLSLMGAGFLGLFIAALYIFALMVVQNV